MTSENGDMEIFGIDKESDAETPVDQSSLADAVCKAWFTGESEAFYETEADRDGTPVRQLSHIKVWVTISITPHDDTGAATHVGTLAKRDAKGALKMLFAKHEITDRFDDLNQWTAIIDNWISPRSEAPIASDQVLREFAAHLSEHGTTPGQMAQKLAWAYITRHADAVLSAIESLDMRCMFGDAIVGSGGMLSNGGRDVYDIERMGQTRTGRNILAAKAGKDGFCDPDQCLGDFVKKHFLISRPLVVRLDRRKVTLHA